MYIHHVVFKVGRPAKGRSFIILCTSCYVDYCLYYGISNVLVELSHDTPQGKKGSIDLADFGIVTKATYKRVTDH